MKTQIRFFIFIIFAASLSCNKATSPTLSRVQSKTFKNQILSAPLIVRLQKGQGTVLAELKLSFEGNTQMETHLTDQKETVQNLVIQTVSEFSYSDLSSRSGKQKFQKQLLSSINQFVDRKSFEEINIVDLKEI